MPSKKKQLAQRTRLYRKLHKWTAMPLLLFMLLMGLTGILLGWKKQAELLPPTQKGQSFTPREWQSLDAVLQKAQRLATDSLHISSEIDRLDVRPGKGIVKIRFEEGYQEVQLDLYTGQVLSAGRRYSDLIEQIHDGSILDRYITLGKDTFKLSYSTLSGLGLILLSLSGFWLWFNPRRMRKLP
ncbi:MAG: PepSY domain-containing protein [Bacteroidota bacterium]